MKRHDESSQLLLREILNLVNKQEHRLFLFLGSLGYALEQIGKVSFDVSRICNTGERLDVKADITNFKVDCADEISKDDKPLLDLVRCPGYSVEREKELFQL